MLHRPCSWLHPCPEPVWSGEGRFAFWYLAYHTLFFLDMYLSAEGEPQFHPPAPFDRSELEDQVVVPGPGYSKDQLLGYLEHCHKKLDAAMAGMTEAWAADPCPFDYRAMSTVNCCSTTCGTCNITRRN